MVRAFAHGAMCRRIDPSCGEPIELFLDLMRPSRGSTPMFRTFRLLFKESRNSSNSVKESKVNSSKNWSRFLVISSIEDGALTKLSPFAIQKAIVGLAGEPKSV